MVKLDPSIAVTTEYRVSCIDCGSEDVDRPSPASYLCRTCGTSGPRALVIDPILKWWIAADGEYWHQSAGVFLRNSVGEYLLFRRTRFPFGLTIPAGHVHATEAPAIAARRELWEETAISVNDVRPLGDVNIVGDSCRRGSDAHHWHCFVAQVDGCPEVTINEEGREPLWLRIDGAVKTAEMVPATSFLINLYRKQLQTSTHERRGNHWGRKQPC